MSIYAISDLHLSSNKSKTMDIFGDIWIDHDKKIAQNWDRMVTDEDTVLIAGDHSWAMRLEDAQEDLKIIADRPGNKILIRGNHDYWWRRESTARIQKELPENMLLMQGHAVVVEGIGITGTRGWRIDEDFPDKEAGDAKVLRRELSYLERGLNEIPPDVEKKIVMLHYPPFNSDMEPNDFTDLLQAYEVDILIYGHIHTGGYLEGNIDGIEYHLVSVDHTNMSPMRIL